MAARKKPATDATTAAPPAPAVEKEAAAAPKARAPRKEPAGAEERAAEMKIKTLVERVAEATGGKKKGVREVVEAVLHQLGEALQRGEGLNLPGLGRTKVAKTAEKGGAHHMTLKLRRAPHKKHKAEGKEPLADDGEDD